MQRKPGVKYFVHLRLWCYLGVIRKVCTLKYENFDPPLSCTLSYVSRRSTPASYALHTFPPSHSPPLPTHTHTYIYRKFVKPRFYIFTWITNKRLKMSKYIIFTTNNYYTYFLSKDKTWGPFLLWNMTSL